ncbi:MAG: hypothetical protein J3K34DRAFT_522043, partial [Monoraphidium minutum]
HLLPYREGTRALDTSGTRRVGSRALLQRPIASSRGHRSPGKDTRVLHRPIIRPRVVDILPGSLPAPSPTTSSHGIRAVSRHQRPRRGGARRDAGAGGVHRRAVAQPGRQGWRQVAGAGHRVRRGERQAGPPLDARAEKVAGRRGPAGHARAQDGAQEPQGAPRGARQDADQDARQDADQDAEQGVRGRGAVHQPRPRPARRRAQDADCGDARHGGQGRDQPQPAARDPPRRV